MEQTGPAPARMAYLLECSRTSHEELLFRIKHRDDWLKLQLLTQIVLLALVLGIELGGVKATSSLPDIALFSVPASFILATLYIVEDRVVGFISGERERLPAEEARISGAAQPIRLFEASPRRGEFLRPTILVRSLAQCVAFVLLPAGMEVLRLASTHRLPVVEIAVYPVLLALNLFLIYLAFKDRWNRLRSWGGAPEVPAQAGKSAIIAG